VTYDPEQSFRYVPSPVQDQVDAELRQMEVSELAEASHVYDRILVMFTTPGWDEVAKVITGDREFLDLALRKLDDQGEWKFVRGQIRYCDWLLSLPEQILKNKRAVLDKIKDLEGQEAVDV
jgi:hypothetical protein